MHVELPPWFIWVDCNIPKAPEEKWDVGYERDKECEPEPKVFPRDTGAEVGVTGGVSNPAPVLRRPVEKRKRMSAVGTKTGKV